MKNSFAEHYILDDLRVDNNVLSARLALPDNLIYFDGHFDGIPVLPGVVQLHWVIDLATRHLDVAGEFCGIDTMKFMRLIQPGQHIVMDVVYDRVKGMIEFTYSAGGEKLSSGKIRFAV